MRNRRLRWQASLFTAACVTAYVILGPSVNFLLSLLPLEKGKRLTDAVYFFVFEAPKVLLLLLMVVFGIGIIRSYFSPERTRKLLGKRSPLIGNVMASLLGIVTPFCSCSAVPLFIGFVEAGVPLGQLSPFLWRHR